MLLLPEQNKSHFFGAVFFIGLMSNHCLFLSLREAPKKKKFLGGGFFGSFSKSVTFCSLEKKIGLVVT